MAWLLLALVSPLMMSAWSQTTYTVTYYPIDDAYVDTDYPSSNYGSETIIIAGFKNDREVWLKFNLTDFTLPVEKIVSAKLKVYVTGGSGLNNKFRVYYVENDTWTESDITFENRPAYSDEYAEIDHLTENSYNEFDITSIVANHLSENDKILSLMLCNIGSSAYYAEIASKEYSEADKWPILVIEYEPYTETTTQTITETITVTDTITETATETQTVTETQTITETQTTYTTSTVTETQTVTNVITETATTTITETSTVWANQTVTVTTTITPTVTETVTANYGNQTANYYTDLANQLIPLVMVIGVICSLLGLLLSATSGRR